MLYKMFVISQIWVLASNVDQTAFPNFRSSFTRKQSKDSTSGYYQDFHHIHVIITHGYSKGGKSSRHCEQSFLNCSYEARCSQCHMECRKEGRKAVLPWDHLAHAQEVVPGPQCAASRNLFSKVQRRTQQETESFIWWTASLGSAGGGMSSLKVVWSLCEQRVNWYVKDYKGFTDNPSLVSKYPEMKTAPKMVQKLIWWTWKGCERSLFHNMNRFVELWASWVHCPHCLTGSLQNRKVWYWVPKNF